MILQQRRYMDPSWKAVLNPGDASDFFGHGLPGDFDADADRYCPINAWWLAEVSRLIYRKDQTETRNADPGNNRQAFLSRVGLKERAFFNAGGVQAAFITRAAAHHRPPVGFLVFRGTTGTWRNWRSNARLWTAPWPTGGRVHSGFKAHFLGLWPAIRESLSTWQGALFFTGHSLGAALATLAAAMHPPRALYTFGSPRVGDPEFARTIAAIPAYRLYNPGDIVTFLPPAGGPWHYTHVGAPIIYGNAGPPVPGVRDSVLTLARPPKCLSDHAPANYLAAVGPGPFA